VLAAFCHRLSNLTACSPGVGFASGHGFRMCWGRCHFISDSINENTYVAGCLNFSFLNDWASLSALSMFIPLGTLVDSRRGSACTLRGVVRLSPCLNQAFICCSCVSTLYISLELCHPCGLRILRPLGAFHSSPSGCISFFALWVHFILRPLGAFWTPQACASCAVVLKALLCDGR